MKVCPSCGRKLVIGEECFIHSKNSLLQNKKIAGISIQIGDCSHCKIGYVC